VPVVGSAARRAPAGATPIEHLIVVSGENIRFDCLFATYEPAARNRLPTSVGKASSTGKDSPDRTSPRRYSAGQATSIALR
jgi:phospholipase C